MRRSLRLTSALYAAMLCVPFEGTVQAQAPKPKMIVTVQSPLRHRICPNWPVRFSRFGYFFRHGNRS